MNPKYNAPLVPTKQLRIGMMPKVVEQLYNAFEDIRYNINGDIRWFNEKSPEVENCFVFLQKHAMSTRDHLGLFGTLWPTIDDKMKKEEFLQRVTILIWSNFVFSLSSVEYFLKNIIKASSKGPLVDWLKEKKAEAEKEGKTFWMYLGNITQKSKKKKIVTKTELKSWIGMIRLRNAIIHNNGIFEKDDELNIDGIKISTYADKSIDTMLINYPKLVTILITLTRKWVDSYLTFHEL